MSNKSEVIKRIERAIESGRGIALSNADLHELANLVNRSLSSASAHQDMLHALIERSPAHASYAIH